MQVFDSMCVSRKNENSLHRKGKNQMRGYFGLLVKREGKERGLFKL